MSTSSAVTTHKPPTASPRQARRATTFDAEVEERLVRYVKVDTQADETSSTSPSTRKQFDLLEPLAEELKSMGARDVRITDYGAVLATIPATVSDRVNGNRTTRP
jgi:tripeptide aminopeptidase